MNILAPVVNAEEASKLIESGADELFCGLMPQDWQKKYSNVVSPNRREVCKGSLNSFDELRQVIDAAALSGVGLTLALNDLYTKEQYPLVLEQAQKAVDLGVNALIVADIGFLDLLLSRGFSIPVHISTGGTTFNSQTVGFYRGFGVSRIILPRHLSLTEIEMITKRNPDIEFEVFILNAGCRNVDGFCTYLHGLGEFFEPSSAEMYFRTAACCLDYEIKLTEGNISDSDSVIKRMQGGVGIRGGFKTCGACYLKEFSEWGIQGVKIVGRDYSTSMKVKDVTFIKTVKDFLKTGPDSHQFREYARELFWKSFKVKCGQRCYYEY